MFSIGGKFTSVCGKGDGRKFWWWFVINKGCEGYFGKFCIPGNAEPGPVVIAFVKNAVAFDQDGLRSTVYAQQIGNFTIRIVDDSYSKVIFILKRFNFFLIPIRLQNGNKFNVARVPSHHGLEFSNIEPGTGAIIIIKMNKYVLTAC